MPLARKAARTGLGRLALRSVAAFLLVTTMTPAHAAAQTEVSGLWPTTFRAGQSAVDCGRWKLDGNGFCVADDVRNGLEVGVKFETSQDVQITGVRIYRADPAKLTGSLWNASGELLATGRFAPGPVSAWQDMTFDAPVAIVPGQTYVASYFTPSTRYAFRYGYFAKSDLTVGPITARRSSPGNPNGVHCYHAASCESFPVRGFRDSSYWVTPLWVSPPTTQTTPTPTTEQPTPTTALPPPRVVRVTPTRHAARPVAKVQITFSQPIRRNTLTPSTVRLEGPNGPVATRWTYDAARHRLVLRPARELQPNTSYRIVVTTRVLDVNGTRLDQDPEKGGAQRGTWTVRIR